MRKIEREIPPRIVHGYVIFEFEYASLSRKILQWVCSPNLNLPLRDSV